MFTFLIVLISLLAVLLCVIILLQSGKGGGLAATFGGASSSTESFMGGRQAASVLTKLTWAGGGVFLFLSLLLAVLSARGSAPPESILRQGLPNADIPASPASVLENEDSAVPVPAPAGQESGGEAAGENSGGAEGREPSGDGG